MIFSEAAFESAIIELFVKYGLHPYLCPGYGQGL